MKKSKVIICMTTFNGDEFLKKQLKSIENQSYSNWILLIHDDGSTDGTMKILKTFQSMDERIKIIDDHTHMGIIEGFFQLLFFENADFYMFCDQDDIWEKSKIELMINEAQKYDEDIPLLVHSDFQTIDENDKVIHRHVGREKNRWSVDFYDFIFSNNVTGCTCLFNKALRDMVKYTRNEIDYSVVIMHDWWLALVASGLGNIVFLKEKTTLYRQHKKNVVGAPKKKDFFLKRVGQRILFKNKFLLNERCKQIALFSKLYGARLSPDKRQICYSIGSLTDSWNPIKQLIEIINKKITVGSFTTNVELCVFALLPLSLRKKFF